jgi:hypothetical protein
MNLTQFLSQSQQDFIRIDEIVLKLMLKGKGKNKMEEFCPSDFNSCRALKRLCGVGGGDTETNGTEEKTQAWSSPMCSADF